MLVTRFSSSHQYTYLSMFFFNGTATTEIYTLSLHDALPISLKPSLLPLKLSQMKYRRPSFMPLAQDRKSTRLNSSHTVISYAVFCLKKKKIVDNDSRIVSDRAKSKFPDLTSSRLI